MSKKLKLLEAIASLESDIKECDAEIDLTPNDYGAMALRGTAVKLLKAAKDELAALQE